MSWPVVPSRRSLHTPLIFSHPALPGLTPPVIDTPVGSVRVAPTIAELVGLGDSALPMERSMVGLLTGAVEPEAEALAGSSDAEAGYRVLWADGTSIVEWRDRVRVHAAPRLTAEDVDTSIGNPLVLGSAQARLDTAFGDLEPAGTWTELQLDEVTETQLRALGYLR